MNASINRITEILNDKSVKAKAKVSLLAELLLGHQITVQQLIDVANTAGDANKASIIESMEYASKTNPELITEKGFQFVITGLASEAPRVKWESAKVIANTVHLFPKLHKKALPYLLNNTEHTGTVVRWSAAGALCKILQCKTGLNKTLIPAIETIEQQEQDNAIRKIYQKALKTAAK